MVRISGHRVQLPHGRLGPSMLLWMEISSWVSTGPSQIDEEGTCPGSPQPGFHGCVMDWRFVSPPNSCKSPMVKELELGGGTFESD